MGNQALVLVLAGVWVALLLPSALRARRGDARHVVGARTGSLADRRSQPDVGEPAVYRFNEAAAAAVEAQPATVQDAVDEGVLTPQMAPLTDEVRVIRTAPRTPDVPTDVIRDATERRSRRRTVAQQRGILVGLLGAFLFAALLALVARGVFVPLAGIAAVALAADVTWLRVRHVRRQQAAAVVADLDAAAQRRDEAETAARPAEPAVAEPSFDQLRRVIGQR